MCGFHDITGAPQQEPIPHHRGELPETSIEGLAQSLEEMHRQRELEDLQRGYCSHGVSSAAVKEDGDDRATTSPMEENDDAPPSDADKDHLGERRLARKISWINPATHWERSRTAEKTPSSSGWSDDDAGSLDEDKDQPGADDRSFGQQSCGHSGDVVG